MEFQRPINHSYCDPLSEIWLRAATALGLTVVRAADAYASTNGAGQLVLATDEHLDADDSLGQMIFHEICHWLVQGQDAIAVADWGLDNETDQDHWREHACLRVQAVLTRRYGLAALLAPTTDFRITFWDQLPDDVLADRQDLSVRLAILALARADAAPFAAPLTAALRATQTLMVAVASVGTQAGADSMWTLAGPQAPWHPAFAKTPTPDVAIARATGTTCGDCAWQYEGGPGKKALRCRQADGGKTLASAPACERFEPSHDCQTCGACCRSAYGAVYVAKRDPFVRSHPELVVKSTLAWEIKRDGDHCAALAGGEVLTHAPPGVRREANVHCTVYQDRPATCRHFTAGSDHCLTARRRMGFSR